MDQIWVIVMGLATGAACVLAIPELRWWSEPPGAPLTEIGGDKGSKTEKRRAFRRWFDPFMIALMLGTIALFGAAGLFIFEFNSHSESGVPIAYRSVHLGSGVSPVVSLIAMIAGFYWWFWQSLSGLSLLSDGRPTAPPPYCLTDAPYPGSDR